MEAMMLLELQKQGYKVEVLSHARAILEVDFPEVEAELPDALESFKIPIEELIAGGGGEAKGTQRLRNALAERQWPKFHFHVERKINGKLLESQSHEGFYSSFFPHHGCRTLYGCVGFLCPEEHRLLYPQRCERNGLPAAGF